MPSSGVQTCALRSEEHTSELQSHDNLVCRLLLEKKQQTSTHGSSGPTEVSLWDLCCPWCIRSDTSTLSGILCARVVSVVLLVTFFFLKTRAPPGFSTFPHPASFRS